MADEETNWVAKSIGHRLEELVIQIYMKKSGLKPYAIRKVFQHPLYPFMRADTDFMVEINGRIYVVECKTSFSYNHEDWENDSVPFHYQLQGQHYASVVNAAGTIFLCLYGNSEDTFFVRQIERDLDAEEDMIEQEKFFWEEYVLQKKVPPLTESPDLVLDLLRRYNRRQAGDSIELPDEYSENIKKYFDLKERKSELDKESKYLAEQMKLAYIPIVEKLAGREKGHIVVDGIKFNTGYRYRNQTSIYKENLEILKNTNLDIYQKYVETRTSSTFFISQERKKAS